WQVSRAGDAERMQEVREVVEAFRNWSREAGAKHGIACLKRALYGMGVISSDRVAEGTAALDADTAERFDAGFAAVREMARERIGDPWVTQLPETSSAESRT
ncbi:MAG: hypothetical protein O6913_01080, partial [Chloroflexi bacterium]|nr:hypothetical protein [Chloroflexota bacterium]